MRGMRHFAAGAGEVTVPTTEDLLRDYMTELHGFIERVYTPCSPRRT